MKNIFYTRILPLAIIASIASSGCGGGGGDGRSATNVSGIWTGALTKVSDACSTPSPSTINVSHNVTQNEDAVTLLSEAGVQFLGNTVGDNGFSVNATHATVGKPTCSDQSQVAYDSINDDTDPTADTDIRINRTCPGQAACLIEFTGTVSRSASATNTPTGSGTSIPTVTPVAGATGTPISLNGGCAAINTHPAAGSYSGNGGCGISDAAYSVQNGTVILSPFGVNGATSFTINGSNTSAASSPNKNLTIAGVAGYSCSLVCSPPATFTLQCFKEGGTTCVEKF